MIQSGNPQRHKVEREEGNPIDWAIGLVKEELEWSKKLGYRIEAVSTSEDLFHEMCSRGVVLPGCEKGSAGVNLFCGITLKIARAVGPGYWLGFDRRD